VTGKLRPASGVRATVRILAQRVAFGILLAGWGLLAPSASASPLAFVINSSDASVSLLDVGRMVELRRVPVLREPHHMALTPDGKELLVGDTAGNEVIFFDPLTGEVKRRVPMADPYQLVFSPDGKWLTVAGLARNQIDIYDAKTIIDKTIAPKPITPVYRIPATSMPSHINYAPDSGTVYVSLQGSDRLLALDVKTGATLWKVKIGPTPAGVLWHDGNLLVGIMGADYVAVVNPKDGSVIRRIRTGRGAHVLFVPPDRSAIYVTNRVDGSVTVLDLATLAPVRSFRVPGGPDDMVFGPDGRIWASQRWAHTVAIIDLATGQIETIPVGRSPHGIWLNAGPEQR
jgi:YVTN family beta-propeller protein